MLKSTRSMSRGRLSCSDLITMGSLVNQSASSESWTFLGLPGTTAAAIWPGRNFGTLTGYGRSPRGNAAFPVELRHVGLDRFRREHRSSAQLQQAAERKVDRRIAMVGNQGDLLELVGA